MSTCHRFWWILEPQTIPKWGPGRPQLSPGHSRSAYWTHLEPKSFLELDFWWFGLDLGSILKGFGYQNGLQRVPKHTKSDSGLLINHNWKQSGASGQKMLSLQHAAPMTSKTKQMTSKMKQMTSRASKQENGLEPYDALHLNSIFFYVQL